MENKTSVLISVYEKENYAFFDLALKSIICDQIKKPDELILICDGPLTKELYLVIEKYSKEYPHLIYTYKLDKNEGLGNALNYGLTKCSNNIIIRVDSDDVCDPSRVMLQSLFFDSHPDISIVSAYIDEFFDDWNKPIRTKKLPLNHDQLVNYAKFRNPINHMAVAFRKEDILNMGSYRNLPYLEDYDLWVRAINNGYKLANIDRVLVHARIGNGMVKRRSNKQYISGWKIINKYMLKNKMINIIEYFRNIVAINIFIFLPIGIKEIVYLTLLRKQER